MFTEYVTNIVSSVYYKHHIKHCTFFLTMRCFGILSDAIFYGFLLNSVNDAIFYRCLKINVKHRANDASNDGHRPPLHTTQHIHLIPPTPFTGKQIFNWREHFSSLSDGWIKRCRLRSVNFCCSNIFDEAMIQNLLATNCWWKKETTFQIRPLLSRKAGTHEFVNIVVFKFFSPKRH